MYINEKGFTLASVLIVSGLIAFLAMTVSMFIVDVNRQSSNLESRGELANISKSIFDYIAKDDNALSIYSYGPSGGNSFPTAPTVQAFGSSTPRFRDVDGSRLPAIVMDSGDSIPSVPQDSTSVSLGYATNNHMNINNSLNALVALVINRPGMCCEDLVMRDDSFAPTGCGVRIDDIQEIRDLIGREDRSDTQVRMVANIRDKDGTLCSGGQLAEIPAIQKDPVAEVKIEVLNTRTNYIGVSKGIVKYPSDTNRPLTIVQFNSENLCRDDSVGTPSVCTNIPGIPTLTADIVTVTDSTNCRDCLALLDSVISSNGPRDCSHPSGPVQPIQECVINQRACVPSDPGSLFFCRAGERAWFEGTRSTWTPCHSTQIRNKNGAAVGNLNISYLYPEDASADPLLQEIGETRDTTQVWSHARVEFNFTAASADIQNQAYHIDARAIDIDGQFFSESHCSVAANCDDIYDLGSFVISDGTVSLGGGATASASGPATGPGNWPGDYQCTIQPNTVSYPDLNNNQPTTPPAPNMQRHLNINRCTAQVTEPGGGVVPSVCDCDLEGCRATYVPATDGNYVMNLTVSTDCNGAALSPSYNWCLDTVSNFSTTTGSSNTPYSPVLSSTLNTQKPCGLALAVPDASGGGGSYLLWNSAATVSAGSSQNVNPSGWDINQQSGCIAIANSGQACVQSNDPCGREGNVTNASTVSYETLLTPGTQAKNSCYENSGKMALGNKCNISEAFCYETSTIPKTAKCMLKSDYPSGKVGQLCKNNDECRAAGFTHCTDPGDLCDGDEWQCDGPSGGSTATSSCSNEGDSCVYSFYGSCVGGSCSGNGAISCSDSTDCVVNGTCDLVKKGTCRAPQNDTCPGCGDKNFCPALNTCSTTQPFNEPNTCIASPPNPSCVELSRTTCQGDCAKQCDGGEVTISHQCVDGNSGLVLADSECGGCPDTTETCDIAVEDTGGNACPDPDITCACNPGGPGFMSISTPAYSCDAATTDRVLNDYGFADECARNNCNSGPTCCFNADTTCTANMGATYGYTPYFNMSYVTFVCGP